MSVNFLYQCYNSQSPCTLSFDDKKAYHLEHVHLLQQTVIQTNTDIMFPRRLLGDHFFNPFTHVRMYSRLCDRLSLLKLLPIPFEKLKRHVNVIGLKPQSVKTLPQSLATLSV